MSHTHLLNFGQLSILRYIEDLPLERWSEANLWHAHAIGPQPSTQDVLDMFATICARNETFRTTYDFGAAAEPRQIVHDRVRPPVDVQEIAHAEKADAEAVADHLARHSFSLREDFGWRARIITDHGKPVFYALAAHHMVCDGWSMQSLRAMVHKLADGRMRLDDVPLSSPGDLARLQRSDAWAARRQAASRYWDRVLAQGLRTPLPNAPCTDTRIMGQTELGEGRTSLATAAQLLRITRQSVLLALAVVGLVVTREIDQCTMTLMSSNRIDSALRDIMTSLNQEVPLTVRVDRHEPFSALARRVHAASLRAYQNGIYDVDDAAGRLGGNLYGAPSGLDCLFNYMGGPGDERRSPGRVNTSRRPRTPTVVGLPLKSGWRFNLAVSADNELTLKTDPGLFPPKMVQDFLQGLQTGLSAVVWEPDTSVRELMSMVRADS